MSKLITNAVESLTAGATDFPNSLSIQGTLVGAAATANTGTEPGQVPLNSDGSGLGSLNASALASGTIPDARISDTLTADKAYRQGNILGTVSQSGEVPTGAIIEKGSYSSTGGTVYWTKLADGRVFASVVVPAAQIETPSTFSTTVQGIVFYRSSSVNISLAPLSMVDADFTMSHTLEMAASGVRTAWLARRSRSFGSVDFQLVSTEEWTVGGGAIESLEFVDIKIEGRWH